MNTRSRALPSRTVNISKWMSGNVGNVLPEAFSQAEVEEAIKLQAELQEAWAETEAERSRDDRLDLKPRECLECGQTARHYRDDYVCFRCRDALDTQ